MGTSNQVSFCCLFVLQFTCKYVCMYIVYTCIHNIYNVHVLPMYRCLLYIYLWEFVPKLHLVYNFYTSFFPSHYLFRFVILLFSSSLSPSLSLSLSLQLPLSLPLLLLPLSLLDPSPPSPSPLSLSLSPHPRLRTLSSGGANNKPPSGGTSGGGASKTGGTGGAGEGDGNPSPLKHSQSHNSFIKQLPPGTSAASANTPMKKFPLAMHRYGREELLQLFSDDVTRPSDIPNLSPLSRTQLLTPLSFMPLSEEEQVSLATDSIQYGRKLSRVKIFANFAVLPASAKVFSAIFSRSRAQPTFLIGNPRKFSPQMLYFCQFTKVVTCKSFRLYGSSQELHVYMYICVCTCTCTCACVRDTVCICAVK